MLTAIFTILVLQLIGEVLQKYFDLAIPGPVIGLMLMLLTLMMTNSKKLNVLAPLRTEIINTSEKLLRYLSLLFVPIGVGVVMHLQLLEMQLLRLLVVIVLGTISTMIFTSLIFSRISSKQFND
ncbi:MAG: CidA/LrgA family protein [Proteobacteria bacterium]|nr:CidA/LrgA family protein [Pseudomonadota bacterium]MDA0862830.1 CidA/LrgA family protein [Pseudomonadota bacterium]MDA1031263.1 CidA/LrgA family protein [Pseudomonadota bacterium]